MAAVMALGIFSHGVLINSAGDPFIVEYIRVIDFINLTLWITFVLSIMKSILDRKFLECHYTSQLNRFGLGTWIAGTSVVGIMVYDQFSTLPFLAEMIAYGNSLFWLVYIVICLKTLKECMRLKLYKKAHGILLLSTVSTQSVVLLDNTVFEAVPAWLNTAMIVIGIGFYVICVLMIFSRYVKSAWTIEADWNNTNCILHGALSITGVACIVSGVAGIFSVKALWFITLLVFVGVEVVEVLRLVKRVKGYGLKKGVLTYDVTQWSRVFTFCMFFTFTSFAKIHLINLTLFTDTILTVGIWFITFLLVSEIIIMFFSMLGARDRGTGAPSL
jgi:hypothetical protein